jgi:ERI1 exoribonuclease 3
MLFLVLDFEAQCLDGEAIRPQEIIEFPTIAIDAATRQEVSRFHSYIRPVAHPQITPFCTTLTGITQEMVQNCDPFKDVLARWVDWAGSLADQDHIIVTCGDWDLKTALPEQCRHSSLRVPERLRRWINIKAAFGDHYGMKKRPPGMVGMLAKMGMEVEGRHHSGIDDCHNIARVLVRLLEEGWSWKK